MSEQPTVCAVMLTADRPEMARRAVESFRRQTHQNKRLLIWDSGQNTDWYHWEGSKGDEGYMLADRQCITPRTVGALRNEANAFWTEYPILCHWDSDDVSHPNRIAEQVALLQASRAEVVGYSNLLFWCEAEREAWLYTAHGAHLAPGTSLCYWRKTWERKPFPDTSDGEDNAWLLGLKLDRVTSVASHLCDDDAPRLIASIHAGNTSPSYQQLLAIDCKQRDHYFRRVPEYDSVCREAMAL